MKSNSLEAIKLVVSSSFDGVLNNKEQKYLEIGSNQKCCLLNEDNEFLNIQVLDYKLIFLITNGIIRLLPIIHLVIYCVHYGYQPKKKKTE